MIFPVSKEVTFMAKKKKRKINIARVTLLVFLLFFIIGVGAGTGFVLGIVKNMPKWEPGEIDPALTSFVYDKNGNQIATLHGAENRLVVKIEDVPKMVQDSFIAAEDHRFRDHFGIDIQAFARAVIANIKHGWGAQGASTITVQLANNAFTKSKEKLLERKIQEYLLAIQLERLYTKDQILEMYLNQVYFGEGAFGVQTAALTYFDKDVSELTLAESALLAGLVQRPEGYNPFKHPDLALKRRNIILDKMYRFGFIKDKEVIEKAKNEPLNIVKEKKTQKQRKYGYFIDHVIKEASNMLQEQGINPIQIFNSGFKIYTTLDTELQEKLEEIYADQSFFPKSVDDTPVQSAAVFLNPHTGEILGMMGGREYTVKRGLNRAVDMKRQPGSTIKPISVYGPAVENGYMPSTVINDAPVIFPSTPQAYKPTNYDGRWRGLITMRTALKYSVNVPAVKMLDKIGVDTGYNFAKRLGLPLLPGDRNLSLALGGLTKGVSPLDMAAAYGAFANQGVRVEPHSVTKIVDGEGNVIVEKTPKNTIVMKEETAYLVTDMLKTVIQEGTGTRARLNRPVAGKTGTTQLPPSPSFKGLKGNKDAWFAAYTPEIVGVVWMGYDETTPKHYLQKVYGGGYPALIWKNVVSHVLKDEPVKEFPRPKGIVYAQVDAKSGKLPSELTPDQFIINEIFTRKTLPREVSDVWVEGEVCAESGKRPTQYCPDKVTGVYLQRPVPYVPPEGYEGVYPEDWDLTYPREDCDIHGPDTPIAVKICIDPRHRGEPKLALVPEEGQSGGCPDLFVIEKYLPASTAPKEFCDIPSHQLHKETFSDNQDNQKIDPTDEVMLNLQLEAQVLQDSKQKDKFAVKLTWPEIGKYKFYVRRWLGNSDSAKSIGSTKINKFIDMHVKPGKTYYYQITWGENQFSEKIKVVIPEGNQ